MLFAVLIDGRTHSCHGSWDEVADAYPEAEWSKKKDSGILRDGTPVIVDQISI